MVKKAVHIGEQNSLPIFKTFNIARMQLRVNSFQEEEKHFVYKFHAKAGTQLMAADVLQTYT